MKFETPNMTAENIEKIAKLFPNCVTEMRDENGKIKRGINFEMLKQMLSPDIVDGSECYEFTWVGKKASVVEANKPIRKTLRPCPEESKDWNTTENLYIEGDNLEVLKLLQESYLGKVKMIYIDPPYNTGNDFIYADDFMRSQKEEDEQMGMYDEEENRLFKNTDTNGRFHSNWCSMMYSRLMLARNLLADDGVIFISIDDNEQANLKKICDEIFGSDNFLSEFPRVTKKGGKSTDTYAKNHDYVLAYTKNINDVRINGIAHQDEGFKYRDRFFDERGPYKLNQTLDYNTLQYNKTMDYLIELNGKVFVPGGDFELHKQRHAGIHGKHDWVWRWSKQLFDFGYANDWIEVSKTGRIYTKTYLNATIGKGTNGNYEIQYSERTKPITTLDFIENEFSNDNSNKEITKLMGAALFDYVKPTSLVKKLLQSVSDSKNSIILDFFSGSATTAHAVMQLNAEDGGHRKFIMVQLPEPCDEQSEAYKAGYKNICEIGKERIRRAGEKIKAENSLIAQNLDIGFRVLKLDDSNMKDVYYSADEYTQSNLFDMVSNIKDDRTDLDLLFGCLIDWGLPLSLPYTSEKIEGCTVHTYNDGDLIACFDQNIPESVIKEIAKRKPLRAVFRDGGFADSPSKINVFEIFKLYMPEDADDISKRVRVI